MVGTVINGIAIVAGGAAGLLASRQLSAVHQQALKVLLGAFTVYAGLSMAWEGLNGSIFNIGKQVMIAILSLTLGRIAGRLLRIQHQLNKLGGFARKRFASSATDSSQRFGDGFVTCSLLFCVGPMSILGSVEDGLSGNYKILLIKSVMDGLATMAFVTTFGWGVMLAAIPVVAYQGTITLLARTLRPMLDQPDLLNSVNVTGGLMVFCIALIILELKKIELADYLPSLAAAPLLTWALR